MSADPAPALAKDSWPGNVAKYRLILDLREVLRAKPGARALDIGCVGPGQPLELWQSLLEDAALDFHLTGIDRSGVDVARTFARGRGWERRVELLEGDAYDIETLCGPDRFDVVVSTQVFEHLARYPRVLGQIAKLTRPGARVLLTMDSAHFGGKYSLTHPRTLIKRIAKRLLATWGDERHYDIPIYDIDLEAPLGRFGLSIRVRRYHNLGELKRLHNHAVDPEDKDRFLERCWELEEMVNRARRFGRREKNLFRCLYYHLEAKGPPDARG